jgi:hypothetical protein
MTTTCSWERWLLSGGGGRGSGRRRIRQLCCVKLNDSANRMRPRALIVGTK